MPSYRISGVRNSFWRNANTLLIGKVQGEGSLTTVMDMLFKKSWSQLKITGTRRVICRSQWPYGLRSGTAAARLLGLWVRVPPAAWMSLVSVVCCQAEVSATGWSLVQRSPTECGVSNERDREAPSGEAIAHNCVEAPQEGRAVGWGVGKEGRYEGSLILRTHKYYALLYKI